MDYKEIAQHWVDNGKPKQAWIARSLGTTRYSVRHALREVMGVRPKNGRPRVHAWEPILNLYDEGYSQDAIAAFFGISRSSVQYVLVGGKTKIRPQGQAGRTGKGSISESAAKLAGWRPPVNDEKLRGVKLAINNAGVVSAVLHNGNGSQVD